MSFARVSSARGLACVYLQTGKILFARILRSLCRIHSDSSVQRISALVRYDAVSRREYALKSCALADAVASFQGDCRVA
jgi:negative regulator of replication initiation